MNFAAWVATALEKRLTYSKFWLKANHCVKGVRILSCSGPHFPAFVLNLRISPYSVRMRENANQNDSKYRCFLRGKFLKDPKNDLKKPKITPEKSVGAHLFFEATNACLLLICEDFCT